MNADIQTGGEIDAWCSACKLELNHIVVAMFEGEVKKVKCLTCERQHVYRTAPGKRKKKASSSRAASAGRSAKRPVAPTGPPKPYATSAKFAADDFLDHPKYGTGRVVAVRGDKIDVEFDSGVRVLIHGRA